MGDNDKEKGVEEKSEEEKGQSVIFHFNNFLSYQKCRKMHVNWRRPGHRGRLGGERTSVFHG